LPTALSGILTTYPKIEELEAAQVSDALIKKEKRQR